MPRLPSLPLLAWLTLFPSFGCSSDDSGSSPSITESRRALAWDERSTLLGFSLADALPDELYVSDLYWNERSSDLRFSPSGSQTRLRWCLAVPDATSPIEEVSVTCDRGRVSTNTRICDSRLEAALLLRLRSDDGGLSEDLPVTFTAFDEDNAGFAAPDLAFTDFQGSFVISNLGPRSETLRLGAFGNIDRQSASGSLFADWLVEGSRNGDSGTGVVYTVANWQTARTPEGRAGRCSDF